MGFCRRMSALPSPLKSPGPAMLQYVGSVGKLTPVRSVVPFMIQITRSPGLVFCQRFRFAVPVKIARTSDAQYVAKSASSHHMHRGAIYYPIRRSPVGVFAKYCPRCHPSSRRAGCCRDAHVINILFPIEDLARSAAPSREDLVAQQLAAGWVGLCGADEPRRQPPPRRAHLRDQLQLRPGGVLYELRDSWWTGSTAA